MKNMKITKKLVVSFITVIILAIIVGVVGVFGMYRINVADDALYNGNYLPTVMAGDISQTVVEQRVYIRNFVIYDATIDADIFKSAYDSLTASRSSMDALLDEYKLAITNPEDQATYDEFIKVYRNDWKNVVDTIYQYGLDNQVSQAKLALTQASTIAGQLKELADKLQNINMADGQTSVNGNKALFNTMTIAQVVMLIIAMIVSMFLAAYISRLISRPTVFMKDVLSRIGTKGDLDFSDEEYRRIEEYARCKDEVGQSVSMLLATVRRLVTVGQALETVANGDLTVDMDLLSERDTMGLSLQKMLENLNNMFSEINSSAGQVSIGSKQIADGAQSLAQGSTEQASAVQQLSASISEIADQTNKNAQMAREAADLSGVIRHNAEKGNTQMDQMMQAVREINEASGSIGRVIKVIDDIAFQTNILALNAAVEAARAGQHGKGFAVVAEEVRSLAGKSAEAAKDTGGLIENSIEKANFGLNVATETAASLKEIVEGIVKSAEIITLIAKSSDEQANAITQVNTGIDQVAQVVQQNSATAEQSAAASEEMSGQSDVLEQLIARFKLKNISGRRLAAAPQRLNHGSKTMSTSSDYNKGTYGKY